MARQGHRPSIVAMPGDRSLAPATVASGYLPGLDGLRRRSPSSPSCCTTPTCRGCNGGFLGVEVFFVISGYLITLLLTQEHERTSTISLRDFWLRRARRLLAALYTLLATVSVVVLIFYREDASKLAGQVWAALTYVTNWFLIFSDQSYFALTERPPVFQHLWSLAIEEQFYLVWPLLLLGLLRLFKGRHLPIAGVITLGAIASLLWMAFLFEPAMDPSRAYYGTDTRASGLLLGAALALVWKPGHHVPARRRGQAGRRRPPRPRRPRRRGRVLRPVPRHRHVPVPRRVRCAVGGLVRGDRRRRPPRHHHREAARPAVHGLGRQAVVLAVPVALADLRVHAAGDRHAADAVPDAGAAPRPHRGGGRAQLPLRRGPDPQRRLPSLAASV